MTESLLKEAFAKTVLNGTRRQWRQTFGMPACDATKCTRLDSAIKAQASKACKDGDKLFARLQTLLLDVVGPLTSLLEQGQKGCLTPKAAADAATQALRFLGNANANISCKRRKHVADCLNRDLHPPLEEEDRFREVAPYLFGKEFERSTKDHIDSVKSLRKMTQPQSWPSGTPFFWQGWPFNQAARGGSHFRGGNRGRGHFHPYPGKKTEKAEENMPTTKSLRSSRDCRCTGSLCIFQSVCGSVCSPKRNIFPITLSSTIHALQSKGVRAVATEIASKGFPLAGRIAQFCNNWQTITQDRWVVQSQVTGSNSCNPPIRATGLLKFPSRRRGMHAGRDPKQTGHLRNREHSRRVLLPNVLSSKKGWQAETCNKPNAVKPISEGRALQNGRLPYAQRPAKSRRLDGQDRPEGCIFHGPHDRGGQKVPPLPVEGKGVSVQLPTLRSVISPLGLYQDHTAGGNNTKGGRTPHDRLHRQYPQSLC